MRVALGLGCGLRSGVWASLGWARLDKSGGCIFFYPGCQPPGAPLLS